MKDTDKVDKLVFDTIEALYRKTTALALELLERRARAVLEKNPKLDEFVMAMGTWMFTDRHGNAIYPKYQARFKAVYKLIDAWDHCLRLTGNPMRFTAKGETRRDW